MNMSVRDLSVSTCVMPGGLLLGYLSLGLVDYRADPLIWYVLPSTSMFGFNTLYAAICSAFVSGWQSSTLPGVLYERL